MNEKKLLKGIYFDRPREGAPDFVKGRMSIKVEDAVAFLQENKNEAGYVNADLLVSKDGQKLYFTLNDWKPEKKAGGIEYPSEEINPSDVPF
jgi:hypothetical protein